MVPFKIETPEGKKLVTKVHLEITPVGLSSTFEEFDSIEAANARGREVGNEETLTTVLLEIEW